MNTANTYLTGQRGGVFPLFKFVDMGMDLAVRCWPFAPITEV